MIYDCFYDILFQCVYQLLFFPVFYVTGCIDIISVTRSDSDIKSLKGFISGIPVLALLYPLTLMNSR